MAVAALGIVVTLALLEGLLTIADYPFKVRWVPSENALAQFDPELGWSYIPNRSVTQTFGSGQRPVVMHFNDIGARVGSPGRRFDSQAPTALFVGDSFMFGHGVPYEESLPGQFEAQGRTSYQVVNLAVQGYGTDQSWLMMKRHRDKFNTKVVVYDFLPNHLERNDNADRRLIFPDAQFLGTKPRFALRPDGELVEVETPARYEDLHQLRLWQLCLLVWTKRGPGPSIPLTRALVQRLRDDTEAGGATFILVLWLSRYPGNSGAQADRMFPGLKLNVVDTGMDAPADWDSDRIPGDLHPTGHAHARVAGLLADKLRQLDLAR